MPSQAGEGVRRGQVDPARRQCQGADLGLCVGAYCKAAPPWPAPWPLTRAILNVLRTLLWGFHNGISGRCFPSYERIADRARVHRSTVARAVIALEQQGVLTWENRLVHQRMAIQGLFGPQWVRVPMRTSNAYRFYDYRRDAFGWPVDLLSSPKSQNSSGTISQENQKLAQEQAERGVSTPLDPSHPLEAALLRWEQAMTRV